MSEKNKKKGFYLPTIILGLIVTVIFLLAIFTYQVPATERALVLRMGRIISAPEGVTPGLHFRWPLPFEEVIKYDVRLRTFDGKIGKYEESTTRDKRQVVIGINVFYRIKNLNQFKTAASLEAAEDYLSSRMRTAKAAVIGLYNYDQLINTDPKKMKLGEMREKMLAEIAPDVMARYGLEVTSVNFISIGVPEKTAVKIAERMKNERMTAAAKIREEGRTEAEKIKTNAILKQQETITKAESTAKKLMADGDAEAARHYEAYSQAPKLAAFLRKLDSMKKIMASKTTLILDTSTNPFNLFNTNFSELKEEADKISAGKKAAK